MQSAPFRSMPARRSSPAPADRSGRRRQMSGLAMISSCAGHIVIIEDVIDDGHLEIDAWSFPAVPAGTPYKIVQRSPLRFSGAEAAADVIKLVAALNTEGLPIILPPGVATPDPSSARKTSSPYSPRRLRSFSRPAALGCFKASTRGFACEASGPLQPITLSATRCPASVRPTLRSIPTLASHRNRTPRIGNC